MAEFNYSTGGAVGTGTVAVPPLPAAKRSRKSSRRSKADEDMVKMSKVAEEKLGGNNPEWTKPSFP